MATMAPPTSCGPEAYDQYIEDMRVREYPMIKDAVYLDHAGTTLYSKSLMDRFHRDMMANLYGNPHSASPSSQQSSQVVENVRVQLLRFFQADPEDFDLVFTANATATIKLVMEALRESEDGFDFGYHVDSHTSVVGVRECAATHQCLSTDSEVQHWMKDDNGPGRLRLLAYPAQSNMNGRRLPLQWCEEARRSSTTYTLLDASGYVSTSGLDLSDADNSPDFTAVSLYKIFGFPDLGACIVRKSADHLFDKRRYFGGGTVDMVVCRKEQWHAKKSGPLYERLEDGTLPIHSIVALKSALATHEELFGTLEQISSHTLSLAKQLFQGLTSLRHANGAAVCSTYQPRSSNYTEGSIQGPVIAFNIRNSNGDWVSGAEVEKLASINKIHLRTGGVCNPGGVAQALDLEAWEMRENFSAGHRCGSENDIVNGKPTSIIRVSLGAMSTRSDVRRFLSFIDEFFVDRSSTQTDLLPPLSVSADNNRLHVESLGVYPIKSCAGWAVPHSVSWEIRAEGLAWDREWCVVHQGSSKALSQKQYPRMALIRPELDFKAGVLRIRAPCVSEAISVPLSKDPSYFDTSSLRRRSTTVCGDSIEAHVYKSPAVADFFTAAIGAPCTLARFPPSSPLSISKRHSKAYLPSRQSQGQTHPRSILLSNESPILTITHSSLNRLNEQIKAKGGKAAHPSVFRANIVLAESPLLPPGQEQPWAEDSWHSIRIGYRSTVLEVLGGCRRCQMVCIDQSSAEKNQEPFVTLAKTRRVDGRVLFGVHTALQFDGSSSSAMVRVGDAVETSSTE